LPGRVKCGGPEEKKANMWHKRGNSGGSWPPAFPRSDGTGLVYWQYFFKPT